MEHSPMSPHGVTTENNIGKNLFLLYYVLFNTPANLKYYNLNVFAL